ncbi:FISUMP domain-containing protein [Marivirga salinae]|uniref:FISUMP domain-containing protein n=1 Tax=Marivirga salinarum TaxID=3059078 RepID=A0AA51NDE3_9BACT|nr:FISUMP domain-containing protein [Marivirga sp. BDSF4-3]WMN13100.1 FISUMP domain-containing protein [Marivirga sp. BDSF4-3]
MASGDTETLIISGSNFGTDQSSVTVALDGTNLTVQSVTDTRIEADVTASASSGTVTVIVNGKTTTSSQLVTINQPPVISDFTPKSGAVDTEVTINGSNFTADATVTFTNNHEANVEFVSASELKAIVPQNAVTGKIKVTALGIAVETKENFVVDAEEEEEEEETPSEPFIDSRDGKEYHTITIGDQVWMAENLAYLPSVNQVADGSEDAAGAYYYVYGYDGTDVNEAKATDNYVTFGVLYNWSAAMNGSESSSGNPSGTQGVCPEGWHLPSDSEWRQLKTYLGGSSVAGGKLKETGTTHWKSPNTGATNETGFTALPGGFRVDYGMFLNVESVGYWWSAREDGGSTAWYHDIDYDETSVDRNLSYKEFGFCVRCVKD